LSAIKQNFSWPLFCNDSNVNSEIPFGQNLGRGGGGGFSFLSTCDTRSGRYASGHGAVLSSGSPSDKILELPNQLFIGNRGHCRGDDIKPLITEVCMTVHGDLGWQLPRRGSTGLVRH
jgi:hypothetical protein